MLVALFNHSLRMQVMSATLPAATDELSQLDEMAVRHRQALLKNPRDGHQWARLALVWMMISHFFCEV